MFSGRGAGAERFRVSSYYFAVAKSFLDWSFFKHILEVAKKINKMQFVIVEII